MAINKISKIKVDTKKARQRHLTPSLSIRFFIIFSRTDLSDIVIFYPIGFLTLYFLYISL